MAIELENLGLTFHLYENRNVTIKEYLLRGLFLPSVNRCLAVPALKNITMSVKDGERVGIIGHNGAGKSTFLKMLAGVYPPTAGTRSVKGTICSLFDINLGFEQEATGWDNIYYRGYLQGETPRTIRPKVKEIAEFCELGDFLNVPVRYYSAGMAVRLAFAIATAINPDILLIDEMLSAGDAAFQGKARERMRNLISSSRVMVMVSHDMSSIEQLCQRVYWFEHGEIKMQGDPKEVVAAYLHAMTPSTAPAPAVAETAPEKVA